MPVPALVDAKLYQNKEDGYRRAGTPREAEAWRRGLNALDEEAKRGFGCYFRELPDRDQDTLLERMQKGNLRTPLGEK
jgi:hypothetical protein